MKKSILALLVVLSITRSLAWACDPSGQTGFAPKNSLRISRWAILQSGINEAKFDAIIKNVFDIYTPVFAAQDALLVIHNHWADDRVNADAQVWGKKSERKVINMYGGYGRHPLTTEDALALVVCHEIGHFLGGAPRKFRPSWASSEGQADYFGTLKCMKRVFERDDNVAIVSKMSVDPRAKKECEDVYGNPNDVALCQRIAMAGKSVASVLGDIHGRVSVSFNTPDRSAVGKSEEEHPIPQCRLDTYFHGTLCDKSFDQDVDYDDPRVGSCTAREGYKMGPRPLCWYKPMASGL